MIKMAEKPYHLAHIREYPPKIWCCQPNYYNRNVSNVACVAGGSGCARESFCGEAANSLAVEAREGIFASGEIQLDSPHSSRDQRGFLHSRSGPTFARVRTPAGYAGYQLHKLSFPGNAWTWNSWVFSVLNQKNKRTIAGYCMVICF